LEVKSLSPCGRGCPLGRERGNPKGYSHLKLISPTRGEESPVLMLFKNISELLSVFCNQAIFLKRERKI